MVDSFEGDDLLKQVVLKNIKSGELIPLDVDGCFSFIGYVPNTQVFEGFIDMTKRGYIKTNEVMETNKPGVFAVGDCRDKMLRQVATAVGDGAIGGFMAEKYVEEVDYVQKEIFEAKGNRECDRSEPHRKKDFRDGSEVLEFRRYRNVSHTSLRYCFMQ